MVQQRGFERKWDWRDLHSRKVLRFSLRRSCRTFWKTINSPIYGDAFYAYFGDIVRSVTCTYSTMDGVDGEVLQIRLGPDEDDPRNI